jgi:hypothetical protein
MQNSRTFASNHICCYALQHTAATWHRPWRRSLENAVTQRETMAITRLHVGEKRPSRQKKVRRKVADRQNYYSQWQATTSALRHQAAQWHLRSLLPATMLEPITSVTRAHLQTPKADKLCVNTFQRTLPKILQQKQLPQKHPHLRTTHCNFQRGRQETSRYCWVFG